jgi:uncharacterized membrane protein
MKKLIGIAGFYSLLLFACDNTGKNNINTRDSLAVKPAVVDSAALKTEGIYGGFIPCSDCRGITTYLLLKPDMTYRIEETHYQKGDTLIRASGNWKIDNGKIYLYQNNKEKLTFLADEERLWQLDAQGNRISGNMGNKFVLNKQQLASKERLREKAEAGIDFIGHGNEPFWSVEIDKGKSIIFNNPDMKKPDTTSYTAPTMSGEAREYHIRTETTKLDIIISPQFCSDGMSDLLYEYKVSVDHNGKSYGGCGLVITSF